MLRLWFVYAVAFALTLLLQWTGNSYGSEWSGNSDAGAHYVTGLLVHDYVTRGLPANPRAFAEGFYAHYPKVGIGHWPPGFYIAQTAWTLLFGISRNSLLLLIAALAAAVLTLTYAVAARYFPRWLAFGGMVVVALLPGFQDFSRELMPDMLTTLLTFLAILVLARHLEEPRLRTGIWFGVLATAAILTKPTAIALAPMPIAGALLLRRGRILRKWAFWSPAFVVLACCLPWFIAAPDALQQSVGIFGGLGLRLYRPLESIYYWLLEFGAVGSALVVLGVTRCIRRRARTQELWALLLLLPAAAAFIRIFIGAWEMPYLVLTLPALTLLLCDGIEWLMAAAFRNRRIAIAAAVVLLAACCLPNIGAAGRKVHLGLDVVAADIATKPEYAGKPILIASDAMGESVFIAAVAEREHRPGHVIERGSKLLATSGYMGNRYRERFASPNELMRFLEANPDLIIVLDSPDTIPGHVRLLQQTASADLSRWQVLGRYPRRHRPPAPLPATINVLRIRR